MAPMHRFTMVAAKQVHRGAGASSRFVHTRARPGLYAAAETVAASISILFGFALLKVATTYESYLLVLLACGLVVLGLVAFVPHLRRT